MKRRLLLLVLIGFSNPCLAASLDANVNSDAIRVTIAKYMARNQVGDLGALIVEKNNKHDNETVLHLGYNWVAGNLRLGFRSIYASPGDSNILALGLGIQGKTALARNVYLGGHFYYAPDAFSFMDGDGYQELALRLMLKLGRSAFLYLGYRNFDIKIKAPRVNYELDDSFHFGAKLYF